MMNIGTYLMLVALLLAGCAKPPPPLDIQVEIRGEAQAPLYYIANTVMTINTLTKILAAAKSNEPAAFVTIYTTLPDASAATRELVRICQETGYERIDIRLEKPPPLTPTKVKKRSSGGCIG